MGCRVKRNRHGKLAFQVRFKALKSWEGTALPDTRENRRLLQAKARVMDSEIRAGTFDYLKWFPNGNKAALFRPAIEEPPAPTNVTQFYVGWIERQGPPRVKPTTVASYRYAFNKVLPVLGSRSVASIRGSDIHELQTSLYKGGLSAATVNRIIHGGLRALVRDARRDGLLDRNPFEFVKVVREEPKDSIDPYTEDERERILHGFRTKRPHYYPFVCFQFWTGARPSEAFALRWGKVDFQRGTATIDRSRTAGFESYTKTRKSRRHVRLHSIVTDALRAAMPLHVREDDFVFRTDQGAPLDIRNFFQREWLPMLRRLGIRPRPFYNTRHTYISYSISVGTTLATVCAQTGTSPAMIEKHYGRYMPQAGDFDLIEAALSGGRNVKPNVKPSDVAESALSEALMNSAAKTGASERATRRNRTGDLLITNQLLCHLS